MCVPNSDKVERRRVIRDLERVTPEKVYERLKAGALLLVCACVDGRFFKRN
jgi:hypothetical protein